MAIRILPLILTFSVASLISASLTSTLTGQEFSRASFTRQVDDDDELPPIVVPSVPIVVPGAQIEQAVQRQPAAERFLPFQISAATDVREQLSNEADTVSTTLKPLTEIQFRPRCADCRTIDFFADRMVRSELPAVSQHFKGWVPADMVHQSLYFEEHCLERCGQTAPGFRQPFVSGKRFFIRSILFPIQTLWNRPHTLEPVDPNECNFFDAKS